MLNANFSCRFFKVLLSVGLFVGPSLDKDLHAAIITFDPAVTISGDTDVVTTGTLIRAQSWSTAQTLNTVTFTTGNTSDIGYTAGGTLSTLASGFVTGSGAVTPLSAAYKALLTGGTYTSASVGTITVTLADLGVGNEYMIQLFVNDSRSGGGDKKDTIANVGGGGSQLVDFNGSNAAGGVGQYIIGTFTADSTTQQFTVNGAPSFVSQINAIQLRETAVVPEPTTVTFLGLCGAFGLTFRRRIFKQFV